MGGGKPDSEAMDEVAMEATLEELREFLDADQFPVSADPDFRERLRHKLWELVQARYPFRKDSSD